MSTFSYFRGKAFLGKPATVTFGENKDLNSWIKFKLLYDNSFAPALGGACAMGTNTMALIQTCQIHSVMTVPHRLSFSDSCQTAILQHVGTPVAIAENSRSCNMLTHVGILYSTFSAFHSGNGFMLGGAALKEWPVQLTHWTNLKKPNYRIQGRSA